MDRVSVEKNKKIRFILEQTSKPLSRKKPKVIHALLFLSNTILKS